MNSRLLTITGGSLVFTAAIVGLVGWVLIGAGKTARADSGHFVSALVGEAAAPAGAAGYVRDVRTRFGAVESARVIDTRNHRTGRGNRSRTYYLSDVLLQTAKGPAVIELKFDGKGYINKQLSHVYELPPREVPGGKLSDGEFNALVRAYGQRGGSPASDLGILPLTGPDPFHHTASDHAAHRMVAPAHTPVPAATPPARIRREMREGMRKVRCVQRAAGDVKKIAAC